MKPLALALIPASMVLMLHASPAALAQQKGHVSLVASIANTKYTQSINIDVGDVPNHIVRIFEFRRTFPGDAPMIDGMKITDQWSRGTADLTNGNGTSSPYGVVVTENGDKLFYRTTNVIQASGGKSVTTQVGFITGGTGKLTGIKGVVRGSSTFDLKAKTNEGRTDIDYVIGPSS